ncbi:L-asparagine oxygenase [Streptomyces capoamus]|uniref:L-asparagine oxygenase n=1 Tax=Streptomyces capoamus TaxID=68183 RepID=A0A919F3B8_9ACTN|nr:guanitoxin biosynthesis L-enduracididine beta-hydroxylase GntD [Streptomyces capoamus]GGP32539.1 L-asparagine oxygenase [Streptomyces libani subsp. rufus]GHG75600.1 L-asparagine oxygenase [Streptomyces capoamus]
MTLASPSTAKASGPVGDQPVVYTLGPQEAEELADAARWAAESCGNPLEEEFYEQAWRQVELLPEGLRAFLQEFRHREPATACLVHGLPVDDAEIGPTPDHWRDAIADKSARGQEAMLALCGLALGDPFGWATLQEGSIVQNVLPIRGEEDRQSGYGSEALLEFHTEDGFHPHRCDYLMLLGLRNPDAVPTIVASVRDVRLDERDRAILSQERYHILPDTEHIRQLATDDPDHPALGKLRRMESAPAPVGVLFGDTLAPYMRIDRPFMRCVGDDPEATAALDRLMAELTRVQQEIVVGPGSLLIVDNYRAAHGRRAFTARFDGTDRWLKKLTVSRNLRRGLAGYRSGLRRVIV